MSTRTPRRRTRASFGSVRKLPSGRYQARYSDSQMNRYTAPQTFATKRAAEDWLATTRADMVRGTWRAPALGAVTVAAFYADHLDTRLDLAPKTRQVYQGVLDRWINTPLTLPSSGGRRARTVNLGSVELGHLSVTLIRQWHAAALHTAGERAAARAETARQRIIRDTRVHAARAWARSVGLEVPSTGRLPQRILTAWEQAGAPVLEQPAPAAARQVPSTTAGRASVAQAYRVLRTILGHAVREGRILTNPCDIPGAGTVRSVERVPATPAEIDQLAAAMPDRYAAAVHVAAWSGLRAGELFGLARRHVDLTVGSVRVERAAITSLNGVAPHLGQTKTASSTRTVHLPPHVVAILADHLDRYVRPGLDALVFTTTDGQIVSREERQRHFTRARASVGRHDLRWHDLRHTGATLVSHAGASLREVQARLGHSTPRAAMIYQHASAERDRELAQRLGALAAVPTPPSLPPRIGQPSRTERSEAR
jgi:integrase